jgi:UDP-4-amino-4-deoxy-L-arabinose-oxoglutarate aminotransferase
MSSKVVSEAPRTAAQSAPFLPFSRPSITEQEIAAVGEVLRSGWITTGARCRELEEAFAARVGCRHAVALTSATAGLHVALHALGIGEGDEVITPAMTWVSTINLIRLCGATPVFVDVDRETLMTTRDLVRPRITSRTRLVVPVHMAGAALDLDPLRALAAERGIALIEDAAHAAGTAYRGRPVGQGGHSIFSLHPIKNFTSGEGGIVCTDDPVFAERIRRLRFHGLGSDAFDRQSQGRSPQAEVQEPGFKYNLPDMNAVLGLAQFRRLDEMNGRRAALAARYQALLAREPGVRPLGLPDYPFTHSWHLFIVRVDVDRAGMNRDEFMERLKAEGIGTGIHFRAAHLQKYYRETMPEVRGTLPATEWNSERICSLPLFPDMRDEDVDRVVAAIRRVLHGGSA